MVITKRVNNNQKMRHDKIRIPILLWIENQVHAGNQLHGLQDRQTCIYTAQFVSVEQVIIAFTNGARKRKPLSSALERLSWCQRKMEAFVSVHCKSKIVVLTQLGYLSCSFTAKECTYKQISWPLLVSSFRQSGKQLNQVPRVIVTGSYVTRAMLEMQLHL